MNLKTLKELAEKADKTISQVVSVEELYGHRAAFYDGANPATILALIAKLELAEKALESIAQPTLFDREIEEAAYLITMFARKALAALREDLV